jgi:hypothetical protein
VAPAPVGLKVDARPVRVIAAAVAINAAVAAISISATIPNTSTVPAMTLSAVKAALVEARTIPAIGVKADRNVLDRSKRFNRQIATHRRAQWRRLDAVRDESACRQDGRRRSNCKNKTMHSIDPPWIDPRVLDQC